MDYKVMWEDLKAKLDSADTIILDGIRDDMKEDEKIRLRGKREGVRLVLSYMNDYEKMQ